MAFTLTQNGLLCRIGIQRPPAVEKLVYRKMQGTVSFLTVSRAPVTPDEGDAVDWSIRFIADTVSR